MTFGRTEMMGILDLRLLGFYKIKQEVLQEHLGRHYHFELADDVCDQYNRFVNLMRKEEHFFYFSILCMSALVYFHLK